MDDENAERSRLITEALATYFDFDPNEVTVFVVCCERRTEDGNTTISSAWSAIPHWHLTGFVDELKNHIEQQKNREALETTLSGGEEPTE